MVFGHMKLLCSFQLATFLADLVARFARSSKCDYTTLNKLFKTHCKQFNSRTQEKVGFTIPVEITVFGDRSFTFVTKTPPASVLIRKAAGVEKGSGVPNKDKAGKLSSEQVREIAEVKLPDLNTKNVESAMKQIAGTARSRGIEIEA